MTGFATPAATRMPLSGLGTDAKQHVVETLCEKNFAENAAKQLVEEILRKTR